MEVKNLAGLLNSHTLLLNALKAASEHLDYCGYGDTRERECAFENGLDKQIKDAIYVAELLENEHEYRERIANLQREIEELEMLIGEE